MTESEEQELITSVREMKVALMGDLRGTTEGALHSIVRLRSDVNDVRIQENRIQIRVTAIEENQRKVWWGVVGICAAFMSVKVGVMELMKSIFSK